MEPAECRRKSRLRRNVRGAGWFRWWRWFLLSSAGYRRLFCVVALPAHIPDRPLVLAVLPFDDLSADREEYLVDSLTEEMITQVTQINPEHLRVIARTSAMQYENTKKSARQIGQELGADYILENSIRHQGGKLRITAQLVRTADQTHVWAENYDRDASDLLPLEREVTAGIAEQVHLKLLPSIAPASARRDVRVNARSMPKRTISICRAGISLTRGRARDCRRASSISSGPGQGSSYAAAYASMAGRLQPDHILWLRSRA